MLLKRDIKVVDLDGRRGGEDLREVGKGKTLIRIYHKKKLFSIKENKRSLSKVIVGGPSTRL